jgi:uncharacterized coiled-coil protein SlyX
MDERDEFELVPLSPLRRLEKRIDQIESSPGANTKEFLSEIVDIIKMNQQLVDQLAKADDALRIEISKLPAKIDNLVENLNELISYIKTSAAEEAVSPATGVKPLGDKLDKLVEANKKLLESNQEMLSALETMGERLKRPALPPPRWLPLRK